MHSMYAYACVHMCNSYVHACIYTHEEYYCPTKALFIGSVSVDKKNSFLA